MGEEAATPQGGAATSDASLSERFGNYAAGLEGGDQSSADLEPSGGEGLPSTRQPVRQPKKPLGPTQQRQGAQQPTAGDEGAAGDDLQGAQGQEGAAGEEGQEGAAGDEGQQAPALPFTTLDELAAEIGVPVESLLALQLETDVNGQKANHTLADIRKGFQLDGHNQQKSQQLSSEHRKAAEAQARYTNLTAQQEQYTGTLRALGEAAQSLLDADFQGINWQQLQREDPVQYGNLRLAYKDRQDAIQTYLGQVKQQTDQQRAQATTRQQAQMAEAITTARGQRADWADDAAFNKDCLAIRETFLANGFKPDELPMILTNPAYLLMADAATRWLTQLKAKPAAVARVRAAPKMAVAGVRQGTVPGAKLQSLKARLRADPKNQDVGAAAFQQYAEDAGLTR